jgi:hypothetical protein
MKARVPIGFVWNDPRTGEPFTIIARSQEELNRWYTLSIFREEQPTVKATRLHNRLIYSIPTRFYRENMQEAPGGEGRVVWENMYENPQG